jgi:predicted RNA-binding protein YlqC (UPF0109 family)
VLAKALADSPDEVRVTETQHQKVTLIELFVSPRDVQECSAAPGRTAAAAPLAATAGEKDGKQVTLEIRKPVTLRDCRLQGAEREGQSSAFLLCLQSCNPEILQCQQMGGDGRCGSHRTAPRNSRPGDRQPGD